MKKLLSAIIVLLLFLAPLSPGALAADDDDDATKKGTTFENNLRDATFPVNDFLKLPDNKDQRTSYFEEKQPVLGAALSIVNFALGIVGTIAFIMLVLTGLFMIISQGNQQAIDNAKNMFKYTIIGLIVIFLSYIIVIFIQSVIIPEI